LRYFFIITLILPISSGPIALYKRQMASSLPSAIQPEMLLRLPRELRDEIYYWAVRATTPLPLEAPYLDIISPSLCENPILLVEAQEALYATNTFTVTSRQGHLWGSRLDLDRRIRRLVVNCREYYLNSSIERYEAVTATNYHRRCWKQLLEVPHLQSLTINLQKRYEGNLSTVNFGPIIYHLRTLRPTFAVTLNISFDYVLKRAWNQPYWTTNLPLVGRFNSPHADPNAPYQPMGFIDVSDLVAPPTPEDWSYVAQYLPDKKLPPVPRADSGLLSETVANRRVLGRHYAVKEPALFRVLMQEQYEVYLKYEKKRMEEGHIDKTPTT
jgi:hypothetical protein